MKTFNVYEHPTRGYEAVKVGFSWPAFFFGMLWMLVKSLWGICGLWFAFYIGAGLVERVADDARESGAQVVVYLLLIAAYFALWLVPGFKGNKWRERGLLRRGFERSATVEAETPDAAIAAHVRSSEQGGLPGAPFMSIAQPGEAQLGPS